MTRKPPFLGTSPGLGGRNFGLDGNPSFLSEPFRCRGAIHRARPCRGAIHGAQEPTSPYCSDEDYQQFLTDTETSIWLYRNPGKRYVDPIWRGEWSG
ncbi:MAG: hypothetical protein FJX75_10380 [Armatimonadetes bacterium]|nr:hypothetical protein [Armatimonadota bacterium]